MVLQKLVFMIFTQQHAIIGWIGILDVSVWFEKFTLWKYLATGKYLITS